MSSSLSHATVTYTSISSVMPSWAIPLMDAYEFDPKEPEAASQSPEHAPLSPVPALDYIADFEPIEDDSEEDPEIDLVDYPSDEEEEEPSTLTDPASPVQDFVPSSEETEPFETDESAATPPSPILLFHYLRLVSIPTSRANVDRFMLHKFSQRKLYYIQSRQGGNLETWTEVLSFRDFAPGAIQKVVTCFEYGIQGHYKKDFPKLKNKNRENQSENGEAQWEEGHALVGRQRQTRCECRYAVTARKMGQPQPPLPASTEALIAEYGYAHTPPSLPPSSLSPLSSPLPLIPSLPLLLPSLDCRAAAATREPGSTLARSIDYGLMTALEEVKESVADMATRHKQDNQEAMYTRQAWSQAMNCNHASHAEVGVFRAETRVLQQQRRYDHDLWTRAIGRIQELERARDP
ncbi:hypothetical protein Tco_0418458 [Tanacetum coccineum]